MNNFAGHETPGDLIELYKFDQRSKGEYARGFELSDLSEKSMLRTYSEDSLFLSSLVEFAQANYSGSHYAIWIADNPDLNSAPVVVFGDEGGYHIVAENIKQLLVILSCDAEAMVSWDRVVYFKDPEDETSPWRGEFCDWLKKAFGIQPTDDADANLITEMAQTKHGENFKKWMKQFVG